MAEGAAIGGPGGRGYDGAAYASKEEIDWDVTELRRTLCTAARAMGCVGQAAVLADDVDTATALGRQLLTFVGMESDPGFELPTHLQLTAVRENAAHALLRLCARRQHKSPAWALPEADGSGAGFGFGGIGHGARLVALGLARLRAEVGDGTANAAQQAVLQLMEEAQS